MYKPLLLFLLVSPLLCMAAPEGADPSALPEVLPYDGRSAMEVFGEIPGLTIGGQPVVVPYTEDERVFIIKLENIELFRKNIKRQYDVAGHMRVHGPGFEIMASDRTLYVWKAFGFPEEQEEEIRRLIELESGESCWRRAIWWWKFVLFGINDAVHAHEE